MAKTKKKFEVPVKCCPHCGDASQLTLTPPETSDDEDDEGDGEYETDSDEDNTADDDYDENDDPDDEYLDEVPNDEEVWGTVAASQSIAGCDDWSDITAAVTCLACDKTFYTSVYDTVGSKKNFKLVLKVG